MTRETEHVNPNSRRNLKWLRVWKWTGRMWAPVGYRRWDRKEVVSHTGITPAY